MMRCVYSSGVIFSSYRLLPEFAIDCDKRRPAFVNQRSEFIGYACTNRLHRVVAPTEANRDRRAKENHGRHSGELVVEIFKPDGPVTAPGCPIHPTANNKTGLRLIK